MAVLSAIHEQPWRILHLAAHGVFEFESEDSKEPVSGLVLDDGLFFTAAEADQLRYVPGAGLHQLLPSRADARRRAAARGVPSAGRQPRDAVHQDGRPRRGRRGLGGRRRGGQDVRRRRSTAGCSTASCTATPSCRRAATPTRMHGETNTWGAYQCYGDPSFSLSAGRHRIARRVVRVRERAVPVARAPDRQGASERWRRSRPAGPARSARGTGRRRPGGASADVCALAAQAFLELGQFERAIGYYAAHAQGRKGQRADAGSRTARQLPLEMGRRTPPPDSAGNRDGAASCCNRPRMHSTA